MWLVGTVWCMIAQFVEYGAGDLRFVVRRMPALSLVEIGHLSTQRQNGYPTYGYACHHVWLRSPGSGGDGAGM